MSILTLNTTRATLLWAASFLFFSFLRQFNLIFVQLKSAPRKRHWLVLRYKKNRLSFCFDQTHASEMYWARSGPPSESSKRVNLGKDISEKNHIPFGRVLPAFLLTSDIFFKNMCNLCLGSSSISWDFVMRSMREVLLASLELLVAILWEERWSDSRTSIDSWGHWPVLGWFCDIISQLHGEELLLNFLIGLRSVPTWAIVNIRYYRNVIYTYIYYIDLLTSTNSIHVVWIRLPVYIKMSHVYMQSSSVHVLCAS